MVCRLICDVSEGVVDKYVPINGKYKIPIYIMHSSLCSKCTSHHNSTVLSDMVLSNKAMKGQEAAKASETAKACGRVTKS